MGREIITEIDSVAQALPFSRGARPAREPRSRMASRAGRAPRL